MRKTYILPIVLAALVLGGQSCLPPPQQEQLEVEDIPAADSGPRLLTEDGQPLPDNTIRKTHVVGRSPCPDPLDTVVVDPGEGNPGECTLAAEDLPKWLSVVEREPAAPLAGRGIVLGLEFNCNIADRSTHVEPITAGFALDCVGQEVLVGGTSSGQPIDLKVILDVLTPVDADARAGQ